MARQKRPIGLAAILEAHDAHRRSANALPDNLGDGYLLDRYPLCRRLRARATELGFRMTAQDRHGLLAWPLGSLLTFLGQREVPYVDNVRALRREQKLGSGLITLNDLLALPPAGNRLAHEAAHCVAFAELFGSKPGALRFSGRRPTKEQREKILRTQLCESFANACEVFAQSAVETGPGELFTKIGFYGGGHPVLQTALTELRAAAGTESAFTFLLLAFLHSNFLASSVTAVRRNRVLAFLGIKRSAAVARASRTVFEGALSLSPRFRLLTTSVYFRQAGLKLPVTRALDFDFLAALEGDPRVLGHVKTLSRFATE